MLKSILSIVKIIFKGFDYDFTFYYWKNGNPVLLDQQYVFGNVSGCWIIRYFVDLGLLFNGCDSFRRRDYESNHDLQRQSYTAIREC